MTVSLAFYADAGLTTPLARLDVLQADDDSLPAVDRIVYIGSTVPGKVFMAASDPGSAQIVISIVDAGAGVAPGVVSLALAPEGLGGAIPGDPLDIGATILSGAENSLAIHIRVDLPAMAAGRYENLAFETSPVIEADV